MLKSLIKKNMEKSDLEEYQYHSLIKDILEEGSMETGRNGKALTIFGSAMYFSLENNSIPILTTKKLAWKTCLRELFWFIKGSTDNTELQKKNVKIWNHNASRQFLDSRGLNHLQENDLGPIYGHQWRFFNANYGNCSDSYQGQGVDQLKYIINALKQTDPEKRNSRRLILSAWNPCQIDEMALPPCHVLVQFQVIKNNKLSCALYQRSGDVGLGVPFNIASYSFLTHILAKHCDLEPYDLIYYLGNAHIYNNHISALSEQIKKEPYAFPTIEIATKKENIEDYSEEDIKIHNYRYHDIIKMELR